MKRVWVSRWKLVAVGIIAIGVASAILAPTLHLHGTRSAVPVIPSSSAPQVFDPRHAAALFVGVRTFTRGDTPEVPYAADDAVDLAWTFALDHRVHLVTPQHVILALSGLPQKEESQRRLRELQHAGARLRAADDGEILELLQQQAALAGRNGLLILSIATHGGIGDGGPYVLSASSQPLPMAKVLDVIARHDVPRSLIFVDACQTRDRGGRGVDLDTFAAEKLAGSMPRIHGQVMLSAVDVAYDDPDRRNGVFTATVIEGLHCRATAPRCKVTVDTLATYVERRLLDWIRRNRNPNARSAVELNIEIAAKSMPLAVCCRPCCPPLTLSTDGRTLDAGKWRADAGARITHAEAGLGEVVAGTRDSIVVFECDGTPRCSIRDDHPLRTFALADLFRTHNTHIVALWGSRLAIYSSDGLLQSSYEAPHALQHVAICRPNPHYAPRIAVTSANHVLLFNPKKLDKPIWSGHVTHADAIESVKILDYDHDTKADIAITTRSGATLFLDFRGKVIGRHGSEIGFQLEKRRKR